VHDVVETVLKRQDHPLANRAVLDRRHDNLRCRYRRAVLTRNRCNVVTLTETPEAEKGILRACPGSFSPDPVGERGEGRLPATGRVARINLTAYQDNRPNPAVPLAVRSADPDNMQVWVRRRVRQRVTRLRCGNSRWTLSVLSLNCAPAACSKT